VSELGQTSDPVDLIPGSVSGLDEFVWQWREVEEELKVPVERQGLGLRSRAPPSNASSTDM
jgi:hypothetical protein